MFKVTYTYTLRRGQRRPRYKPGQETVYVTRAEVAAKRYEDGVPAGSSDEMLARYCAADKRLSRAYGRQCTIEVEHLKHAEIGGKAA